jgi:SAM-dependent methyltransferase
MENVVTLSPVTRFSNRVENYVKYRPSYPETLIPFFEEKLGLTQEQRIADIGSGTGLFASILLKKGYRVTCIEPNEEMRKAGEKMLGQYLGFESRKHPAEQTGLRKHSVELITVAQAFHWMEPVATKKEFLRILKPGGHIVLAWNLRLSNTPFLKEYAELKAKYELDADHSLRQNIPKLQEFFEPQTMIIDSFPNIQMLDFDALKGQLLSSSYIPLPGHSTYDEMISALAKLFVTYNENGLVRMEFETRLYWAKM